MSQESHSDPFDTSMPLVTGLYIGWLAFSFVVYVVLKLFWGDMMLVNFHDLQGPPGTSIWSGIGKVWFIFPWGVGATLLFSYFKRDEIRKHEPAEVLGKGIWLSLNAGLFEELIFRWFAFVCAMVTLPLVNLITFGFVQWFYTSVLIPVANWSTLGALEPQLLGHPQWVFGAAIVLAAAKFRDAHEHLGFVGWLNSWFLGMIMFWLMFNYGIWTAVVVHALYDVVVFAAVAVATSWKDPSFSYSR